MQWNYFIIKWPFISISGVSSKNTISMDSVYNLNFVYNLTRSWVDIYVAEYYYMFINYCEKQLMFKN